MTPTQKGAHMRDRTRNLVVGGMVSALAAWLPACGGHNDTDAGAGNDTAVTDAGNVEDCANGTDDDGDGAVDCADSDCAGTAGCNSEVCDDFVDNDADGDVDCQDADCTADPACANPEDCTNGVDDNGDGQVDCADVMCLGISPACGEVCGNGVDDDADGEVDCNDTDCTGVGACSAVDGSICAYNGAAPHVCQCADGIDNDGDGTIDSGDIHCFGPLDDNEAEYATGIPGDNNGSNGSFECPFDGNSGPGNDRNACCNADPTMNATPNGCDFIGCCELDINGNGTGEHVHLAGACDYAPACGGGSTDGCPCTDTSMCDTGQFCVFDDDVAGGTGFCSTCEPCTPDAMCDNPCSCGEMCFGGFTQPDCGTVGMCPTGVTECPGGNADCTTTGETCVMGCCYATCPAGVSTCTVSADCPDPIQVCVTGCCVYIG